MNLIRCCLAEFLGTFFLILIGCGTIILFGDQIGQVGVALTFGLAFVALAQAFGSVSQGYFNPAITVGMMLVGRVSALYFIFYTIMQIIAAVMAGFLLLYIANGQADFELSKMGLGVNGFGIHSPGQYTTTACWIVEILGAFMLVMTALSTIDKDFPKGIGPLITGFAYGAGILFTMPVTNGSLNPIRSLSVAIFQGGTAVEQLWFFWIFPIAAAVLAVIFHKVME